MSTDRTEQHTPHPAPRDIEGTNPEATFVKCPDCLAAIFNLRHQRQAHLRWHDDLDADVASAQEAAQRAQEAAERAERTLGEARRELADLRAEIAAQGPTAAVVPLVGEWPADEIAEHEAARTAPTDEPTAAASAAGIPLTAVEDIEDDDDLDAIDLPASRF